MPIIEVEQLTRTFNTRIAVNNITFGVNEGTIFGFLGPNGAGKTTTIRMLTGQLRPTSGQAYVAGYDVLTQRDELKPCIGVVSEHQNLYERMSARENLLFIARLYGVARQRVDEVLEQVNLLDRANDKTRTFSNGMKQRMVIARAILHRPQVLFLDEPTRGLDPSIAQQIRNLITELAHDGMTIFLTTHYMEEADQLCDSIAFFNQGSIVALDTPEALKLAYGQRSVEVSLQDGSTVCLALDDPVEGMQLGELAAAGQIQTLHSTEATLEDVFLQLTGHAVDNTK
ncbi:MAG: ABC transporter ATP-binding protein [Chloroflexota bacterium]